MISRLWIHVILLGYALRDARTFILDYFLLHTSDFWMFTQEVWKIHRSQN